MKCQVCNRNLAPTLSICPACGTMMNDSVREELQLNISAPSIPVNAERKAFPVNSGRLERLAPAAVLPKPAAGQDRYRRAAGKEHESHPRGLPKSKRGDARLAPAIAECREAKGGRRGRNRRRIGSPGISETACNERRKCPEARICSGNRAGRT